MRSLSVNLAMATVMLVGSSAPVWAATPSQILGVWKCSTIQDMGGADLEIASSENYLPGGKSLTVGRMAIKVKGRPYAGYEFQGASSYQIEGDKLTSVVERLDIKNILNPDFEKTAKLGEQLEARIGQPATSSIVTLDKKSFVLEEPESQTVTACSRK